uniref:hypothetical protein n=1 Tax=Brucella pseudintermedia TaxID=370111 RepID=UPI001589AD7E|nr:hypothetical protein [Brucella pseudintermedia]
MMKTLFAAMAVLTITGTAASAASTENVEGLFLGNVRQNDCERTKRDYQSSAAKGLAILKEQRANPLHGTSDAEPSYLQLDGEEIRDTSLIRQGKIIKIESASPRDTWFYLQGTGSVKQVSKLRLMHVEDDRWMLAEYMRGPSVMSLQHIGPIFETVCKL